MINKEVIYKEYNQNFYENRYYAGKIVDNMGPEHYLIEVSCGLDDKQHKFRKVNKLWLVEIINIKESIDEESESLLNIFINKYSIMNDRYNKAKIVYDKRINDVNDRYLEDIRIKRERLKREILKK